MTLTPDHRLLIESQVQAQRKSVGVAYLLWLFLGLLSIHRFYLDRPGSAIAQLLLNCIIIGIPWTLIDVFLIPGMIRQRDAQLRTHLMVAAGEGPTAVRFADTSKWAARDRARLEPRS
jgi:TM2 domain-containing membrane protein YozV